VRNPPRRPRRLRHSRRHAAPPRPARLPQAVPARRPVQRRGERAPAHHLALHDAGLRPGAHHPRPRHAALPVADRRRRGAGAGHAGGRARPDHAARRLLGGEPGGAGRFRARHREHLARTPLPHGGPARPRGLPRFPRLARRALDLRRPLGTDLHRGDLRAAPGDGLDRPRGRADPVRSHARHRVLDLPAPARGERRRHVFAAPRRRHLAQRRSHRQHGHAALRHRPLARLRRRHDGAAATRGGPRLHPRRGHQVLPPRGADRDPRRRRLPRPPDGAQLRRLHRRLHHHGPGARAGGADDRRLEAARAGSAVVPAVAGLPDPAPPAPARPAAARADRQPGGGTRVLRLPRPGRGHDQGHQLPLEARRKPGGDRPVRRRQDHAHPPPDRHPPRFGRARPARRRRRVPVDARGFRPARRLPAAGRGAVRRHRFRQHRPHGRRFAGRGVRGGPARRLPRDDPAPAQRLRNRDRRQRPVPFGRPAPAHRLGPRHVRPAEIRGPGRAEQQPRRRFGGAPAARPGTVEGDGHHRGAGVAPADPGAGGGQGAAAEGRRDGDVRAAHGSPEALDVAGAPGRSAGRPAGRERGRAM
ncbi:MAG: Tetraacyldisaccharide 4'-kinase, partial [uncultured Acetobacteraceae bacterium]